MKRVFDLAIVLLASPVLLVIGAVVAVSARTMLGTPVMFAQARAGKGGRPFFLMKFRTMTIQADANGKLLPDEQRVTRFGNWLRSTSLDELPTLLNVLRGDMSLVGPRPLHLRYLPRYNEHQKRRHEVLPGVTGWAQLNGRNSISWETKFELDVWYVEHRNLWLDLRIIGRTLVKVFRRQDTSPADAVTMAEFMGSGERRQ